MGEDNDPPKNPFIRWKQHVDTHIGTTLHGLLGIPTMVSKNLNIRGEFDKGPDASPTDGAQPSSSSASTSASNAPAATSSSTSSQSTSTPQATNVNYHSTLPSSASDNNDDSLDGVDASQLLEWHKFIYYSPYSPLKLQQQQQLHLLPPLVPQDVPFGADPFAFTYADAFEDLLRTCSGRPLLDLADRSYRNLRYQMRYGSAIEPPYVFFHRMHSQRLLDAYFPRSAAVAGSSSSVEEARNAASTPSDDVVRAVAALAERDRDLWREQMEEEDADKNHDHDHEHDSESSKWDEVSELSKSASHSPWEQSQETTKTPGSPDSGYGGGLFDELDRVFRVLNRIIHEETGGSTTDGAKKDDVSNNEKNEPSAEDELYNSVRSAYANAEKSLGALIKSFSGGFDSEDRYSRSSSSSSASTTETSVLRSGDLTGDNDGRQGETIQTTEEHVDAFGNRHVKITVQRLDADGNEVSRETRYTIRSQSPEEIAALKDTYNDDDEHNDNDNSEQPRVVEKSMSTSKPNNSNDGSKASGWFWK
ncbi:hypothetical protein Sste5346_002890 [Sporothrix stenoceras]|uniref:Uncharacterized protein n=1 Tax=Sporothrix stenoceras TaxID=5173 RepID=A0ABR3ZFQ7_9PEZI